MDPFYCLVRIILNKKISLYCFNTNYKFNFIEKDEILTYPICFTAKSADKISYLLSLHNVSFLFSIKHISSISIELYKAELTIVLNQMYIQN